MQALPHDSSAEPPAIERIFALHHRQVAHAAYRITGNASDAEDVLQTVFLRLLGRPGLGPAERLGPYLRRAAVNAALDLLRRRRRRPAVSLDEQTVPPEDPRPAPDRRGLGVEIRDELRRALAGLSPQAAEIFALRFFEGYGNKEIADLLGTTQGAVGVALHRARQHVRRELGDYLGEQR